MTRYLIIILAVFISACDLAKVPEKGTDQAVQTVNEKPPMTFDAIPVTYPKTRKDTSIIDDYHGVKVADPYRWLEDDNSSETKQWVLTQNQSTFSYLDKIPFRDKIETRLRELWNYERYSTPFKEGGKYYYFKNDGLQNQSILYVQDSIQSKPKIALNPNQFSNDGTSALGGISFNDKGNLLAYQVSEGGSDWHTAYVKDLNTGQTLTDTIKWIKFSGLSWYKDGFFYSRYPEPQGEDKLSGRNEFHQVFYHKIGTPQAHDELVLADRRHPNRGFSTGTTHDERFLTVGVWESTSGNALFFRDLNSADKAFTPIIEDFKHDYNVIDNIGEKLVVLTNHKAPNQRLILIDVNKPGEGYWEELIPETKDVLQGVEIVGGKIVATYIHNAASKVRIFDITGKLLTDLNLPGIGTVGSFSGKRSEQEAFYSFTSFTRPTTIYKVDMNNLRSTVYKAPKLDFNPDLYVTKQVWYEVDNGLNVPMFITHKKGLKMDGKRPTLLYGYGGFNISILPSFNTTRLAMCPIVIENDGIFAVANIRGGGEFGADWHKQGTLGQKQNVFNDFIAAAEYLISERHTSSDKLAIYGRSNGGLLVGACMTQRPDLFKVALPAVGVLDMLRYQNFTIGRAWSSDYGLSEKPKDFDYLYAYSPLHNIDKQSYPATMITTADHDDRVVPAHSFKFAAELQDNHTGPNPTLIRIETSAGHGAGKSTAKKIEEASDILGFIFYNFKEEVKY